MKKARRMSPRLAAPLLLLVALLSAILLVYSRGSSNALVQVITMLVSMGLVFYSGHPFGHYVVAKAYGVGTDHFFVGRSDFRKLKTKPMSIIGGLIPTIGTKLNKDQLASLPPRKRGYVFGAGVIFSNTLVGIEFVYVLVARFSLPAVILGAVFFVGTLATEFMFSTQVGDLGKMRREFNTPPSRPPPP